MRHYSHFIRYWTTVSWGKRNNGYFNIHTLLYCELGMSSELDLKSLWKELDVYEEEMKKETKSLQEVWLKIAQIKTKNEGDLTE